MLGNPEASGLLDTYGYAGTEISGLPNIVLKGATPILIPFFKAVSKYKLNFLELACPIP